MKTTIRFFLSTWSILVFVEGIRILMPTTSLINQFSLYYAMPSLNSTGLLLIWASIFSLFFTFGNRLASEQYLSALKMKIENPFNFHEHIFRNYEDRYYDDRRWKF